MTALVVQRLKVWGEIVAIVSALGGAVLWLTRPRLDSYADARAAAVVQAADAPVIQKVAAVSDDASTAAQEARSANAMTQEQVVLVGALACLQGGGTLAVDECVWRGHGDTPDRAVSLKNVKGLVSAMAVRGR